MSIRIGLDSECLNYWKRDKILNALDDLEKKGKIETSVPTTIAGEQVETQSPEWRERYLERISQLRKVYEAAFLGKMYLGENHYTGDSDWKLLQTIAQICFKKPFPALNNSEADDVMALEASITSKLDFFITKDKKHFIDDGRREELLTLGIMIREPNEEFIEEILKIVG